MRNCTLLASALIGLSLTCPVRASVYLSPEDLQEIPLTASKALAEDCPSVDLVALEGDDLTVFVRTISEPCFERAFFIGENPSLRDDAPTVFGDRNLQAVLAEIGELAATYDGTNGAGMLQLWRFVQISYEYYRYGIAGVGPFDEETDRAYLAASDALAASDHFYAANDEAARILYYYFEAAYASGFRRNHLGPIKQVLSGFTAERAVTGRQAWAPQAWTFIWVLRRVHAAILHPRDQEFIDAVAQDPEFIEVMLRVTRYGFFFFVSENDPFHTRIGYLNEAIDILVRLTWVESSRESAIAALQTVLSEQDRLSSAFLVAAKGLESHVDCESLNICREVLEEEILVRAVPNTYRFEEGALVFQTSLDLEEVLPLYHGIKAVQAQFHRLVETDDPVEEDRDAFTARIYGGFYDYRVFESYLTGADTWGIHGGGVYGGGEMRSWIRNRPGDASTYGDGIFEETVRHEYAHYLADRFGLLTYGGPWFDEGLAEFLVGSTQAEGVLVRRWPVNHIFGSEHLDPAGLFDAGYSADLGGGAFYNYAGLFFHFMYQERRTEMLELFDLVRSGDAGAYAEQIERWREDPRMADDLSAFLVEQISRLDQHEDIVSTEFIPRYFLTIDSVDEIESALHQIDGDLELSCHSVDSELSPRFLCSGRLAVDAGFTGDRGELSEHLNARLDAIVNAALGMEEINNLQEMNCYFADVGGSPPVADLSCDGPLRPGNLPASGVDLSMAIIHIPDNPEPEAGVEYLLQMEVDVPYVENASRLAASNYKIHWSSNVPIRVVEAFAESNNRECEITEMDSQTGRAVCGNLRYGVLPEVVVMYLVPSEEGRLEISLELSSDEFEFEPTDNVDTVELTVGPAPIRYPLRVSRLTGNWQKQGAGQPLEHPLVVEVRDQYDDLFEGAHVTYAVMAGDEVLSTTTDTSDANGRAAAIVTLPREPGRYRVEVTIEGVESVAAFTVTAEATPDFNGDGATDFADFFLFAEAFGGSDPRFDLDDSGEVDFADFFLFAESFGQPARAKLLALARDRIGLPDGPGLQQNAPNPFNSQTVISWFQLQPGPARLEVFALTGQRVAVMHEGPRKAGFHRLRWDGRDARGRPLASGVYFYRLVTGEGVNTRKLTLLR